MPGTLITPRQSGHPGYSESMARTPETTGRARTLARIALSAWHMDKDADTAALLLSELFTNAVRHAAGERVRVIVERPQADRVHIAVVDRAPHLLPRVREAGGEETSGRGLALVEEIADRWGYQFLGDGHRPWGKRVWAEMQVM
ncbi:ATP-binding protein [Streptomyces tsukubensis]|uniref:ATP-binding protein n=1 Tax=Streptomyces tsukubensis TaxID=83656 RepID=UPI0034509B41